MAFFPLFINLAGKKTLIVGGGEVAARKIKILLEFGTRITAVSPEVTGNIADMEAEGRIRVHRRCYLPEDMEGTFLAIAATSDPAVNDRVYADASVKGIWVNVADNPEKCTFIFPSITKRRELVIGISTSGNFPALSKYLREMIENHLPDNLEEWICQLGQIRGRAQRCIRSPEARREALELILSEVLLYLERDETDRLPDRIDEILEEYADEAGHQGRKP